MFYDLAVNLSSDLIAVLFAVVVWQQYKRIRFGGWKISIRQDGEQLALRSISVRKAEAILEENSDLSVYVKGVVSPFGWLKKDVLTTAGLMSVMPESKLIIVNLEKGLS